MFHINVDFNSFSTIRRLIECFRFDSYGSGFELWFRLYGNSNNVEKFNSALNNFVNLSKNSDESFLNRLNEIKKNFDDSLKNFNSFYEKNYSQTNGLKGIWENYNYALKDVKDVYTKINELFSLSYYAGCTY